MPDLLDANVWLSLSIEDHDHHERSVRFWKEGGSGEYALCRMTELALLRLLSNESLLGEKTLSGRAAWQASRAWRASPLVVYLDEPPLLDEILGTWGSDLDVRGKHWTDTYLAAFATASGSRLVSFDSDFERFPGLSWLHLKP